ISLPMTLVHLTSTSILLSSCNDTALTEIYTLSLHDALPISQRLRRSIADYFDTPFYLWYVQAERLIDLRDEELALREEEALGERSEEHTSELQSRFDLVCRLLLEKKKKKKTRR